MISISVAGIEKIRKEYRTFKVFLVFVFKMYEKLIHPASRVCLQGKIDFKFFDIWSDYH